MIRLIFVLFVTLLVSLPAFSADGMLDVESRFSVDETANRMEKILKSKGMTVFNRIKHSDGARKVGITLRDTQLIIFGNPKVGSPLMVCQQSVAIDLPQKALIWQDENKKVWISYNDPSYLVERHHISGCDKLLIKIGKALAGIAKSAASL